MCERAGVRTYTHNLSVSALPRRRSLELFIDEEVVSRSTLALFLDSAEIRCVCVCVLEREEWRVIYIDRQLGLCIFFSLHFPF